MAKKRKPPMTKVVPVKMSDDLYARLQDVAGRVGEADSTIIRIVLRAGLSQIERDNYELFRLEPPNPDAPRSPRAAAGNVRTARHTSSTHLPTDDATANRGAGNPAIANAPAVKKPKHS